MAKRNKRRPQQVNQQPVQQKQSSFWMITALVAVVLLVGVSAKTMFSDREGDQLHQSSHHLDNQ